MNFLRTVIGLASSAWNFLTGLPGDVSRALQELWKFVNSVHDELGWMARIPLLSNIFGLVRLVTALVNFNFVLLRALARFARWIIDELVNPLRLYLLRQIAALRAWTAAQLAALTALVWLLHRRALAYTDQQVGIERQARIADVKAARAYALALTKALHATIEHEAASGYRAGLNDRLGVLNRILDEVATRNPVVRGLVADLVKGLVDLAAVDNPIGRLVLGLLISHIINRLGVDRAAGELARTLLGPLIGDPRPADLTSVIRDICDRLTGLEGQWATFMEDGGPEILQAGTEWKNITGLIGDAALLGFVGLAVADPGGWARDVSATLGTVVDSTIIRAADLIRRA